MNPHKKTKFSFSSEIKITTNTNTKAITGGTVKGGNVTPSPPPPQKDNKKPEKKGR